MLKIKLLILCLLFSFLLEAEVKIPNIFTLKNLNKLDDQVATWVEKMGEKKTDDEVLLDHTPNCDTP